MTVKAGPPGQDPRSPETTTRIPYRIPGSPIQRSTRALCDSLSYTGYNIRSSCMSGRSHVEPVVPSPYRYWLAEAVGWTGLSGPAAAGQDEPVPVGVRDRDASVVPVRIARGDPGAAGID